MYDRSASGASGLLERECDVSSSIDVQNQTFNPRQVLALIDELRIIKMYQPDGLSIQVAKASIVAARDSLRIHGYDPDNESELLKQELNLIFWKK